MKVISCDRRDGPGPPVSAATAEASPTAATVAAAVTMCLRAMNGRRGGRTVVWAIGIPSALTPSSNSPFRAPGGRSNCSENSKGPSSVPSSNSQPLDQLEPWWLSVTETSRPVSPQFSSASESRPAGRMARAGRAVRRTHGLMTSTHRPSAYPSVPGIPQVRSSGYVP